MDIGQPTRSLGRCCTQLDNLPSEILTQVITPHGSASRGLSRNKICIGISANVHGASLHLADECGKTSRKRTWDAFGGYIAQGTVLVYDREKS